MRISEFLYTATYKFPWINSTINKLICAILPTSIRIKNAIVMLNPRDPVISGALTFGVYEKNEILMMQKICQPGKIILDIGANVGLYTAIAGTAVGENGRVIAFEPDPDSCQFLKKTVLANQLKNVTIVEAAAASQAGETQLFTSSGNRGDHRLYSNACSDGQVEVSTVKVDDCLRDNDIKAVDVIKIDVQGFEAHVFQGMQETILQSPNVVILMEFWPLGLISAGSDPLEFLQQLENLSLSLYEIKKYNQFEPIINKNELIAKLLGRQYVNLVLLGENARLPY